MGWRIWAQTKMTKKKQKTQKPINELRISFNRLKFYEFLRLIKAIFYLRFRPLDVLMYAFGTKNEDFRPKSPYPLDVFEGSSSCKT